MMTNANKVKKFDFRRKLKGLNLISLNRLRDYHLDLMLGFLGFNDKEADRHSRYLGYIEDKIDNINCKSFAGKEKYCKEEQYEEEKAVFIRNTRTKRTALGKTQ